MAYSYASNLNLRGAQRGAALTTATSSFVGVVRVDNTTLLVDANGTISAQTASSSVLGLVKPDGTSVLVTGGVISVATPDGTSIDISGRTISIATSSNGFGVRTVSTGSPSGGVNGDIWYQY